jgi:hypothetical protein
MKSITFASGTIVTGSAVAAALVQYVSRLPATEGASSVQIPVQEANGLVATHTIVLGPGTQFDIADIDGVTAESDEDARFPVPEWPDETMVAVIPETAAAPDADNFDRAVADIDSVLDDPTLA